jgi:hypothetical protein
MSSKTTALFFVFVFTLLSCADKHDRNTAVFSHYLQNEFQSDIPDQLHYYVLLPKISCKGCSANTLTELDQLVNPGNKDRFSFISTNEHAIPADLKIAKFFQYDERGRLDDLDMEIANVTIIKTKAHKVIFIKPIYIDEKKHLSEIITF